MKASKSVKDQYEGLEIPPFLKRNPNETREDFRKAWTEYDQMRQKEKAMRIEAQNKLDEMIKDTEALKTASLEEIIVAYNAAMECLERPADKVTGFRDTVTAVKRMEGVLITLRIPPPKADKKLKPVDPAKAKPTNETNQPNEGKDDEMTTKKATGAKAEKKATGKAPKAASTKTPAALEKLPEHKGNVPLAAMKEAFDVREGSNREKLLTALAEKQGKQVAHVDLLKAVYGSKNLEGAGKLSMVMKGLLVSIEKDKLPFAIGKAKDKEGAMTFGIYSTKKKA